MAASENWAPRPPSTHAVATVGSGDDVGPEVAQRFGAGDRDALVWIYRQFRRSAWGDAMPVLQDRQLAEDSVTETFLRAWRMAPSFDPARPLAPWLFTLARRSAIDVQRREFRPSGGQAPQRDGAVRVPDIAEAWEAWQVRSAVNGLPPEEQEAVRLAHLEGLTHVEIAYQLGVPLGTITSRSHGAHRRLAERLRHLLESDGRATSTEDHCAQYLDAAAEDSTLNSTDRARLDRVRRILSDPATWDAADLETRLLYLAAVTPQDGQLEPDGPAAARRHHVRPAIGASRTLSSARTRRLHRLTVAVAAAAAALAFALVVPLLHRGPQVEHYSMAGTTLTPRAMAAVDVESKAAGDEITLHITGLPPAPPGSYYAGWLTGPAGTVPVGTFHWRQGGIPVELWSGVDTAAYPAFVITLQREAQPPTRSDQVVLRGSLRP